MNRLEKFFTISSSLILNKILIIWTLRANSLLTMLLFFFLFLLNFLFLAKLLDNLFANIERSKNNKRL